MNILVTGSHGQLGSELQLLAPAHPEHQFVFTDVDELDITDPSSIESAIRQNNAQCIINCAAYTQVDRAEDDVETAELINHKAVVNLAQAAAARDIILVQISTDYVFGGKGNTPFREDAETSPLGVYARTKLESEQAVRNSGCRHLILRTAWLYSTFGNNFVKTMLRLMGEREQISVVFDQVGTPTYARDLADAILRLLGNPKLPEQFGTYNYTNEGVCSWYDFAVAIAELSGLSARCTVSPCHSDEFPSKVTRPAYSVLDKTAIRTAFDLRIPHWRESLACCVRKLMTAQ